MFEVPNNNTPAPEFDEQPMPQARITKNQVSEIQPMNERTNTPNFLVRYVLPAAIVFCFVSIFMLVAGFFAWNNLIKPHLNQLIANVQPEEVEEVIEKPKLDEKIVELAHNSIKKQNYIRGMTFLKGADLIESKELDSLADFQQWKRVQEFDEEGNMIGPIVEARLMLKPVTDAVNQEDPDSDQRRELVRALRSIGNGYVKQ